MIGEDVLNERVDHRKAAVAIQSYAKAIRILDLHQRWADMKLPPATKKLR